MDHRVPKIPYPFYPGGWECSRFPGERLQQATQTLPSPGTAQPIPPDSSPGAETPGLLSLEIHPAPQTQMHIQSMSQQPMPCTQGMPCATLPSWGLISTEDTALGPRLIFFKKGGNDGSFTKIVKEEREGGRGARKKR